MSRSTVFEELTAGNGPMLLASVSGPDLAGAGYQENEYAASGSAHWYQGDSLPTDGRFALRPGDAEPFSTRVLVRRPVDPSSFNGTLVVEWLNVSSGQDSAPDYSYCAEELVRRGYAWAGVSAQSIGVEGGRALVGLPQAQPKGLKQVDPQRYSTLSHPGDEYAYDMFDRIAAALGSGAPDDPLAGLRVERRLAVGESQSAFALCTYVNGVAPSTAVFDGYLIHSRAGGVAPVGQLDVDLARATARPPTRIRDDLSVPVIVVQTETDLFDDLGYLPARQPDSMFVRLWEIAGTAHADKFQIGEFESFLGCATAVNRGQQAYVVRAALRRLDEWARGGGPAPAADRLATHQSAADAAEFVRDEIGNVAGGVRTPAVDAPVALLSGRAPAGSSRICRLFGSTTPLDPDRLRRIYASRADYLDRYRRAAQAAVDAGFLLADDFDAVLAEAEPATVPE